MFKRYTIKTTSFANLFFFLSAVGGVGMGAQADDQNNGMTGEMPLFSQHLHKKSLWWDGFCICELNWLFAFRKRITKSEWKVRKPLEKRCSRMNWLEVHLTIRANSAKLLADYILWK